MVKQQSRILTGAYVLGDLAATYIAFFVAYVVRFRFEIVAVTKGHNPFQHYLLLLPIITLLWPAIFYINGLYNLRRLRSRVDEIVSILWAASIGTGVTLFMALYARVYYFYGPPEISGRYEYSQLVFGLFIVFDIVLVTLTRGIIRGWRETRWRRGEGLRNILIAGAGELGRLVADKFIDNQELGFRVLGFVDGEDGGDGHRGIPILGNVGEVDKIVKTNPVDILYVALPIEEHDTIRKLISFAGREGLNVKVAWDYLTNVALQAAVEDLDGIPVISLAETPIRGWNWVMKRAMDIAFSAVFLVFLAVPFAVIAVLVKLTSKGPVFYTQERMGLDGRPFTMYKFRSMHDNAEKETGPVWATSDDPRRTLLGRFLRFFNIDELPQLFNVFKGDMSLVGPRPERPTFVQEFKARIPQYMLRHKVKAGITGWAQVNGWRGNTSIEKRIEHDIYYIENWTLWLDVKILWLTFWRVLLHKHAY
jgi:exopolysaccharide biosynthesis polyprenyl glycosylphosphotransferase